MKRFAILAILVASTTLPGRATPVRCSGDPCEILTTSAGYVTPTTEIASGGRVVWTSTEASHPTSNSADGDRCFLVTVGATVEPVPVLFEITGQGVRATTDAGVGPLACTDASPLPDGSYLLPFRCLLHVWMNGALLITRV